MGQKHPAGLSVVVVVVVVVAVVVVVTLLLRLLWLLLNLGFLSGRNRGDPMTGPAVVVVGTFRVGAVLAVAVRPNGVSPVKPINRSCSLLRFKIAAVAGPGVLNSDVKSGVRIPREIEGMKGDRGPGLAWSETALPVMVMLLGADAVVIAAAEEPFVTPTVSEEECKR